MDNLVFRFLARVVAILDLITASLMLLFTAYFGIHAIGISFYFNAFATSVVGISEEKLEDPFYRLLLIEIGTLSWYYFVILCFLTPFAFWAAMKLVMATQLGRNRSEALDFAIQWKKATITFVAVVMVSGVLFILIRYKPSSVTFAIIGIFAVIRAVFLLLVQTFIAELERGVGVSVTPAVVSPAGPNVGGIGVSQV